MIIIKTHTKILLAIKFLFLNCIFQDMLWAGNPVVTLPGKIKIHMDKIMLDSDKSTSKTRPNCKNMGSGIQ